MKYVRVYESDCYPEEYVTTYLNHCEHVANLQYAGFDFEGCIVKQADTIEELCDWFVLRKDGKIYQIYTKEEYAVADLGQYTLAFEWYYAIDTDKGLIYVAKMNDKGELELL